MIAIQMIALVVAASPTTAEPREAPAPTPTSVSQTAAKLNTRYCVVTEYTGSRVPKRVCHTRTEWMQEGYDPLAGK